MDCRSLLRDAQRLLTNGLQTAAAGLLEDFLAENAPEPAILCTLAQIRMHQQRASDAAQLLKQALRLLTESSQDSRSPLSDTSVGPPCPCSELTYPSNAVSDDDWELIETTGAARQGRRRYLDLEGQPFAIEAAVPADVFLSHSSTQETPTELVHTAEENLPLEANRPDLERTKDKVLVALEGQAVGPRSSGSRDNPLTGSGPEGLVGVIQTQFDFELPGDEAEDKAQLTFEANLQNALDTENLREDGGNEEEDVEDEFEAVIGLRTAEEVSELDWEEFALDADDFDEAPTREDLCEVQSLGQVTRLQRARQHAVDLARQVDWDEDGTALLTQVFDRYWWGRAKESMRRELQAGMRPEELRLALELREVWASHAEFAMDFSRLNGYARLQTARAIYRSLSWPMALALVRLTDGYPDVECLEHFLCELFDEWYTDHFLRRRFKSFNVFLFFRLRMSREVLPAWPLCTFEPDEALAVQLDEDFQPGFSTPAYRALNRLGLLPHVFVRPLERARHADCADHLDRETSAATLESAETVDAHAPRTRVAFEENRLTSLLDGTPKEDPPTPHRPSSPRVIHEAEPVYPPKVSR